jgi:hypothetical protein
MEKITLESSPTQVKDWLLKFWKDEEWADQDEIKPFIMRGKMKKNK